ncbi:microtubule-associated protein futsch isoform X3 [Eucalyptus grandis]|uniref:microtubule-associated protein futsch isoform X3 n=1 Tax=Eucalyptus grandis TaxID=71139 RepID=UPI00192F0E1B|nr:microtubule-associated protein futsch isoform X3 [Eucalyptus grandis]
MTTENKIAEAVTMESELEKRSVTCELLDPILNKFSSEESKKSPGMQDLPAEISELHAEDVHSSCEFAESTHADRKDIDRASEGEKFLESSSEAAIVMAEDNKQLLRAETLETDDRMTDEEKHFQEEKGDKDYDTDDVTSAVSRVAKTVEANFNIIEEQTTNEVLDQNVDTGCGPKVDCTDNVANMDPTFVPKSVGDNIFDVESEVSEKLLDLPAEQKVPQSLDICKQKENEKVEIDNIIQNGARDASIAAVAASSDTPNDDTIIRDEGDKMPDESSTTVAADMSMKHEHEVGTVELKETTSTESQDLTELSAEMKQLMPEGENEEYKSNSTGSAVIIEPVAHSSHQIDEGVALKMDVEEANDLTQETIIQVVQNTLAKDEDGVDRKDNLDNSPAKHEESAQRDYSNLFSTEASEEERNDSGYLTGEVVTDASRQGITDAKDHIAKEIPSVEAEAEGSFLQPSLLGNEQPDINTVVQQKAVSCIKEDSHSKSCEGGFTQNADGDKSVDDSPNDGEIQENSPLNPEGDEQRTEVADLEVKCEKVTGEWEACKPKEAKTEDESEACSSREFQDAAHPSREGHDPKDVATDIAAPGDIYSTESVADATLRPTFEPEIVLETAPASRAEPGSCCGEKEQATEVDENEELKAKSCNTTDLSEETIGTSPAEFSDAMQKENECEIKLSEESEPAGADKSLEDDAPQDNESSETSLQIPPPTHGEMTREVEGEEKGTSTVILADNSSITGLEKVIEEAPTPEKDSEETVNKNEGAKEFERSLNETPEPTEVDITKSPKTDGTILCHEELSAEGNNEDNVNYEQNETNEVKIYEQTGRSSTKEGPEDLILLKANEETGESTVPDLIEEDPIRHGHDPEDVATDIAAPGDIYSTQSDTDVILQLTFEPEIVLETAPTSRAEPDSCCGDKEKATEVDENEEVKAKSCNTTDLTDLKEETIGTSPADNSDTTQEENECEIKLSEESEAAGDRSLEGDAPEDNESSEKSPQIPLPTHGEMTLEVEGEENGKSDVVLADNSSVTGLDKVIEQASMPEKDSEEIVNKDEGANEFKRPLDEIPEPTEADSTDSAKTDGTILCHEELLAKGNNEDNAKYEQNETNKIYEQTGRSSTTEGPEEIILLKANKETGESMVPDLIEEDPIQHGHDPEDVATDIAASGDIYSTESATDDMLQPTFEPENVLETAPTSRAEHDSCCGKKEQATEVDENEEVKAKSCNTTDLTEETIGTSPAENSDTTQKENECEIKLSKESEAAGADRSLEGDAPEDNESSEKSPKIPLPTHGEMTHEVEGEEKGKSDVILADNSSITGLDKVIEQALMPEKDSEEIVNKNEGANEFKRSLDEIPEPTEADCNDSAKTDGTILCHEELSAKGNDEDNAKYEQNEINKIYEQTGRSSTAEGLEEIILHKANKETGESTAPDLIEEDPIQHGHDPEDVATDISASGDIYSTERVTDTILQPTFEPEIVLKTAPTSRAEPDSCCGDKEQATAVEENEEVKAKSCNTTDLTDLTAETIGTSPAENSDTTQKENEREIKLSEESEAAGDRSLEGDAPEDNESSEKSPQIPPPMHGEMTLEVEGEEKGKSDVILADNSSVTGLDKVIEQASMPEKDSEEIVNKDEGANEFKRPLDEIPEPTEADSTDSAKTDGTILCHEELSAKGNNEDNAKYEQNETNKIYEQTGRSSTTEGPEEIILLKANKETGKSMVPDLIEEDPIQHGHDPEDVATDIAASGDIYSTESATDDMLQPTFEPEIVLETAPTSRAEHDSCCGKKEQATEVDENEEVKAKSCNTTDLTDLTEETIGTSLADNSDTTQKENESEIKLSEESEAAGADRSLEGNAPEDNESSEKSPQIPPPTHGEMTLEVEGEEKGKSDVILADNSSITGLDKVIEQASMSEKDSEEMVNKNEGANEFKRLLDEIPEPTEADSNDIAKTDGTILCHEELSAKGNDEDNAKYEQNEINKIDEQTGRSSTAEGPEEIILLKANKETGESTAPDLIKEDPIQHGHDPEDVATDISASGDIYSTERVTDAILQPTFEPEIVLKTAPTSRAEPDSCCGDKEQAAAVDENEEVKAKSCNTTDLTDLTAETIRTSLAENSDTTQKENECEIKLSEESEAARADRSVEGDAPHDNKCSEMSPQIPPPTHGEMTWEVEGEEKGTCDVSLADNSSITRLDKVIEQASMPEKDSEEIANKNEGANELKRSLNEKPEPTEADSTDSAKTEGTILCHEELSAKGNDEDNAKYEENEINKIYEQTGRSSTTEGPEEIILLKANKETGESTAPDLIEEDPIQHGHNPEDVATDIAASGDIYSAESATDDMLQPTFEPEIVLETTPTSRAEHDSCCEKKEQATEVDENEEVKAKSCNTTDLTDLTEETIGTSPAENSDATQKENECEIKLSEESEAARADRSLEGDAPEDNESSEMSPQIPPPTHGEMTREVEGEEKGTSDVILADNSSVTALDKVIEQALTPENDSEETLNKNEGAKEFQRSLNEIPEPTEADSTDSAKADGTILCHEELSAKGNDEDNAKYEQNEINKIYEQTGRASTTEALEEIILLIANTEAQESTAPDLIEKDPIQERTTKAIAHGEDNAMGCQINPSTEEADYTKDITEETNKARDFEVPMQSVTFTSREKTDEREEDAKSKLSPAVDEQESENQKSKFMIDAISLNEEDKDAKDFTEQMEAACSIENTANTEKDNTETCNTIHSTSIEKCSEKEMPPKEHDEYHRSDSPFAPPETSSEVNGAAESLEVPSASGSQAAQVSGIEDGIPANDNEPEAKNDAASTDIVSAVDELPTLAKQDRRLENTDSNVKEDDLTDLGQEKGETPVSADATKELTESEILDKEPKDFKDLGTTEKPALDISEGRPCSILKTEAGEEECEASAEYEGPDKNEGHLFGAHSTEGVLMPQDDESTNTVSESEEVETAKRNAQKEVSEDLHVAPEVHFADLNIAKGTYISASNGTEETENQTQVDQHNAISDERSVNTYLEMKEIEGETHDEALKHQESFAPETDIKNRTLEGKVSTENAEDNLKEDPVPDKAAFHSEISTPITEEKGAADTTSTQNLKTMELTEKTETTNMEIEEHSGLERETYIAGEVEEEVQYRDKEDPVGLVITPVEIIKEDTIKEPDSAVNRDIAAVEIGQEEVRPPKKQLDDRPNMASGICSDMGLPERTEIDHGEEIDGTEYNEISTNLPPKSSESDTKSAQREITVVENPTTTEEIELPSDKKDETRASDAKESTETENCTSIENADAEETEKLEEISERLATSSTQNGEAVKDGSTPDQTTPRESTLELLTPASMSLLEEKEGGPKTADEKIKDDKEEEVEMQLNENLQLSSGTVQTEEACFDKKETNNDGVSEIDSEDSEGEKDIPNEQKNDCTHGEEVLKVETQEKESKTTNPDSPEVDNTTAKVSVITEEASSIVSSKSENAHEVVPDIQTNESFTRLEDADLKGLEVEATIADVKPEQKCEDAIEAIDISQNAITDEVVLQGQLKTEDTQNEEELETGEGDKKLLLKSCKIDEMKDFVPVLEDSQAIDQAEEAQAGNVDNEEIQISKIENDGESISTSKTADATKDIEKEVVKETATLDHFNDLTTAAVETEEIGIPAKEASSGVFDEIAHEVMSDAQESGSSIELEHDEMKGMKVEAVAADVKPEEKCEAAIEANRISQNGIINEGVTDENKKSEETQHGEQRENGEGDTKTSEKKDCFGPILAENTEEKDQDEQAQAGNADTEQNSDKLKDGISVSKTEDPTKDFDENIKKTDTLDELNVTTIATVETAAEISIPKEEASGVMFPKGEHIHEISDVQTNESSIGSEDADMNTMRVEAVTADVEPAEKCDDGIEEIDMSHNEIINEGMTDEHMKAPLLESCNISEKKESGKALIEVTEAADQVELAKARHADNEEFQSSESKIHDRLKDSVSVSKTEDATKDVEKEIVTEACTTDEFNATSFITVPENTEIKIPTEEASGFVLSKSANTYEIFSDVQAKESSMGSEDSETNGMQGEEVVADVKPEEKHEDAIEANDMSQNAITSEEVLDSHTKAGVEENETREGDNASLLGSCKINEKKDFGPVVAGDTEATDQVEEAESENADNEEIQTSKSKTDDKLEDSVLVCKTADATKDIGKTTIEEVDTSDEFNTTTIAAAETEIAMRVPQEEETRVGTSTVPPDIVTVQNSNADDFERIGMVSELSHDSNSTNDETIDGAEKTSNNEKLGLVESEVESERTAHQVTVPKTDQGKTVLREETTADQTLSEKKPELLVQTPVFASLPGGGEENIEKVENVEGNDKVAGEMELKENLELSSSAEKTDTECLERRETRNSGVTELEISASESTHDTNEDEKEQNTHGEALKAAPEEKEKETELADSPLSSIKNKELSGTYEKASDVMFKTSKTAQGDVPEVQTMETFEELEGGEIQDVNLEAVAISEPAEQSEDAILADNVEEEMRNEQEKADGIEEINEQETTKDVDSKETHGTTPGNSIINQDMHTGSESAGQITLCDEQTNAEMPEIEKNLASKSESYVPVALEKENILNGGGIYIAQAKDALQDFDVTEEIKEEAGSCFDKTDTAAMTSLRTETGMLAIQQDDKPVEASPPDLEGPSPEATEPGLILSSKNIDKENLEETSASSVSQLSDTEIGNATIQNPHVSESRTNVVDENDSSLFLAKKEGEAATMDENFGEKSLDGEMGQSNENKISTGVTEVSCEKADSIKHADTEFEIQANRVTKDTCEEDKEGSNQVENLKPDLPEEESERRSVSAASADLGDVGTLAVKVTEPRGEVSEIQAHEISAECEAVKIEDSKEEADDLKPEKHCDIATEAADTLKDEIIHEQVNIGPGDSDERENLMKEHQVEENCDQKEIVAVSPGNRAICEEGDSNAVSMEHIEASYSTEKTKRGNSDVEEIHNGKCDAQIQEVLHQEKIQEEENCGSVAPTEHATKDSEELTKELDSCYVMVDAAPKTSLVSIPSSCPKEEKPVDDSGTGFDKELPKQVETETSLFDGKGETQLEEERLATDDENVTAENLKADGLGRITIASEAVLGSRDPGMDVIDAREETTAEELDVSESRSHCPELVQEADATSDQNTSAKEPEVQIQTPVSALHQEEHKDVRKQDTQNVQETETVPFSSAAEAKEEIWQKENRQFEPPKVHSRGSETIQDDLTEKYNECSSTQDEGWEPESQNETKCTDFPSDSEKLAVLTSATESHEQEVCDDLVKSASQVKIQEDFNEPKDTRVEENQVYELARDFRAEEKGEETSKANETSQGENTEGQGKSKHSAVEDIALKEFDKVHFEMETVDKNYIDEGEGKISSEGVTESDFKDQHSKANSGSSATDALAICNEESSVEKTQEGDNLDLEEVRETNPVLEQKEYASIAMPEMPVSGEACLRTTADVTLTEGNEDRSPAGKERNIETIQNSEASNVELGDPSKADLELKGIEYGGERTCSSDAKTSEEELAKDTSVGSLTDLLSNIPQGNSPTTEPSSKERRPTDEPDIVPPQEVKREEERDEHEEDEHERTEQGHDAPVMVEASKDIDVKVPHKKSHNILSGVSSKVKHSISKVKKAITGKSSHSKAHSPK